MTQNTNIATTNNNESNSSPSLSPSPPLPTSPSLPRARPLPITHYSSLSPAPPTRPSQPRSGRRTSASARIPCSPRAAPSTAVRVATAPAAALNVAALRPAATPLTQSSRLGTTSAPAPRTLNVTNATQATTRSAHTRSPNAGTPPLTVACLNATGLNLPCSLESLGAPDVDVLCIGETWHSGAKETTVHSRHDIELMARPPSTAGGRPAGGVRLLSGSAHPLRLRASRRTQCTHAIVCSAPAGVTIAAAYISPSVDAGELEDFFAWLRPHVRGTSVLLGDLNARHEQWDRAKKHGTDRAWKRGDKLHSWTSQNNLRVYSSPGPTHTESRGSSNVDVIVARNLVPAAISTRAPPPQLRTSHQILCAELTPSHPLHKYCIPPSFWADQEEVDAVHTYYSTELRRVSTAAAAARTEADVDAAALLLQTILLHPLRRFGRRTPARFRRGWTKETDKLSKKRARLLHRKTRGDSDAELRVRELDRLIYHKVRARKRYLDKRDSQQAEAVASNDENINEAVKQCLEETSTPTHKLPAGVYLAHVESVLPSTTPIEPVTFTVPPSFLADVNAAITKMDASKTGGPDAILPRCLKLDTAATAQAVLGLWTACGRVGHTPASLLAGRITPVFKKKGDARLPENYRPIMILNVVRRVISAAVDLALRRELQLHTCQWGFRLNTGTLHAIAHAEAQHRHGRRHRAVLDMSAAYDRAPRQRILQLLHDRGVPTALLNMSQCLLTPGTAFVTGAPTKSISITGGVPQGDPLSPLLFNVLMDDLLTTVERETGIEGIASCYADDVLLLARSRAELQRALDALARWAEANDMKWNTKKSAEINSLADSGTVAPLRLASEPLPLLTNASYLGVDINSSGVTDKGVRTRISAARRRIDVLRTAKQLEKLSVTQRRTIVQTHVLPKSDYALHAQPLPPQALEAAADVEQRACTWILQSAVTQTNLPTARAVARISSMSVRRSVVGTRAVHKALKAIKTEAFTSRKAQLARTLLSCSTLTTAGASAPSADLPLKPVTDRLVREEYKSGCKGRRPVPIRSRQLPALRDADAPTQRLIASFYMNRIRPELWNRLDARQKIEARAHLLTDRLEDSDLAQLHTHLRKILQAQRAERNEPSRQNEVANTTDTQPTQRSADPSPTMHPVHTDSSTPGSEFRTALGQKINVRDI